MKKRGVTLIEIMVVVIIIGILAAITIPNFGGIKEDNLDKEAKASLRQMNAAERIYYLELEEYYPNSGSISDIGQINDNLKLALPAGTNFNWNYACSNNGCVQATRNVTGGRTWRMRIGEADPVKGGTCP